MTYMIYNSIAFFIFVLIPILLGIGFYISVIGSKWQLFNDPLDLDSTTKIKIEELEKKHLFKRKIVIKNHTSEYETIFDGTDWTPKYKSNKDLISKIHQKIKDTYILSIKRYNKSHALWHIFGGMSLCFGLIIIFIRDFTLFKKK